LHSHSSVGRQRAFTQLRAPLMSARRVVGVQVWPLSLDTPTMNSSPVDSPAPQAYSFPPLVTRQR
jgi:hypothetical protein